MGDKLKQAYDESESTVELDPRWLKYRMEQKDNGVINRLSGTTKARKGQN